MPEQYFRLSKQDRSELLGAAEAESGKSAAIIEKDIWLVWILGQLFKMPDAPGMTFKGGTALSKVFGVIERFSEDVDITVNYLDLDDSLSNIDLEKISRSQQKKISDNLKVKLKELSSEHLVPYLQQCIEKLNPDGDWNVIVDETGENIEVHYPCVTPQPNRYMPDRVLIELGGRNPIDPSSIREISTELQQIFPKNSWPVAQVNVLSPERTYWEKVTLIHVECHRPEIRDLDRKFRHWFDLSKLADHEIGLQAAKNLGMLRAVIAHKKVFFHTSYANYDDCLTGNIQLIPDPDNELLQKLREDFDRMVKDEMFYSKPPAFDDVMKQIADLQNQLNEAICHEPEHLDQISQRNTLPTP